MQSAATNEDIPFGEYWTWVGGTLYLLLTLDVLTTLYASMIVGIDAEANPIMQELLAHGPWVLAGVNVVALGLLGVLFYGLIELIREAPTAIKRVMARAFEVWIGLLLAAGLFVFANNLSVIVHGQSLL